MDDAKYVAIDRLWSPSENKYIEPGEVVQLNSEIASKLLDKKAIKPYIVEEKETKKWHKPQDK